MLELSCQGRVVQKQKECTTCYLHLLANGQPLKFPSCLQLKPFVTGTVRKMVHTALFATNKCFVRLIHSSCVLRHSTYIPHLNTKSGTMTTLPQHECSSGKPKHAKKQRAGWLSLWPQNEQATTPCQNSNIADVSPNCPCILSLTSGDQIFMGLRRTKLSEMLSKCTGVS